MQLSNIQYPISNDGRVNWILDLAVGYLHNSQGSKCKVQSLKSLALREAMVKQQSDNLSIKQSDNTCSPSRSLREPTLKQPLRTQRLAAPCGPSGSRTLLRLCFAKLLASLVGEPDRFATGASRSGNLTPSAQAHFASALKIKPTNLPVIVRTNDRRQKTKARFTVAPRCESNFQLTTSD